MGFPVAWPGRLGALATLMVCGPVSLAGVQETDEAGDADREHVAVTYRSGVSRIFNEHCVVCHSEDGIAPFSLATYEDVRRRSRRIRRAVEEERMPPWFASREYGEWRNDRRLPAAERRDLLAWIDSGAPEGSVASVVPERPDVGEAASPNPTGWSLSRDPDLVIRIPEPMEVEAKGVIPYQYVFTRVDLAEDQWLQELQLRPTDAAVVHHVAAFLQGPDDLQRGPYLTLWTGRTQPTVYPKGTAKRLPAGAWIMFEVHYTPTGTETVDRTELGLVFSDGLPEHEAATLAVATRDFEIPPHEANHAVIAETSFWRGGTILSLLPHMHRRGKAFRYELERTDGSVEVLLDIPRYDFRWQLNYEFATPVRVEAGDVLRARAWYDNSANNPTNPDPEATVYHGPQGFEEMMAGFFEWVGDPVRANVVRPFLAPPDTIARPDNR